MLEGKQTDFHVHEDRNVRFKENYVYQNDTVLKMKC